MSYRLLLFVAALIAPSLPVLAEDAPAPMYARVFTAELQPNSQRAYEEVLKKFAAAHEKLDTKQYFGVSTQVVGSPTTYTFVSIFRSFADMDQAPTNVMVDAYGAEQAAAMVAPLDGKVWSQETGIWMRRLDLSPAQPENPEPPAMTNWLLVTIKPYGNAAYEAYLKKVAEATNTTNPDASFVVWAPGPGGDNTYAFANPVASWAAMDEGGFLSVPQRLEQAFGKREADRLLSARAALVESQATYLSRSRPELSYLPEGE